MAADCGGCAGLGAHRRWCRAKVGLNASVYGPMGERLNEMADQVGANNAGLASALYALSAEMREWAKSQIVPVCGCGREIRPPDPDKQIVASAGFCAPAELRTQIGPPAMCTDCKSRMLMIATVGIDPGRDGENLKVRRGGIRYGET